MTYRTLNSDKIVETIDTLQKRIADRFPNSGLSKVCAELHTVSQECKTTSEWIERPQVGLRLLAGAIIGIILVGLVETLLAVDLHPSELDLTGMVQVLEAGMNAVVLIGASILFLVTVEARIKRTRALKAIHEIRVLAQVIDMHQLTKDPEKVLGDWQPTRFSPKPTLTEFELGRYLDYCSEMLSLCGKVGSLYAQSLRDDVVLAAATELETLTTGLSRKIWQKIMLLHRVGDNLPG